ncbi:MAG: hypothetical protein KJ058_06115 [Thermoanaerobaculia bacterium]|nr:hypothetical protein [Thermoanaerobaculia bacterium]
MLDPERVLAEAQRALEEDALSGLFDPDEELGLPPAAPPPVGLFHPELGVPVRVESAGEGLLATFEGPDGEELVLERRGGAWLTPPPRETPAVRRAKPEENASVRRLVREFEEAGGEVVADPCGRRYAVVRGEQRLEVLDEDGLRGWLATGSAGRGGLPAEPSIRAAAFAIFSRPPRSADVFLRVGWDADCQRVWLDLGDSTGDAVEVDRSGWRVTSPGVLFRRPPALRALPRPVAGGSLYDLSELAGLEGDERVLVLGWLLGVLQPGGPFPVLALSGQQGSGKSTLARLLKSVIDPTGAPLRALPKDDREVAVAARGSYLLAFDNVSGLPAALADSLCRIATGAGFAARQLYSDSEQEVLEASRPVLLTSIGEAPLARPDLADRALSVVLPPRRRFRPDADLAREFEAARPRALGALLDAAAGALDALPDVPTEGLPRMASFARWVTAAEHALAVPWPPGDFLRAYDGNRAAVVSAGLDGDSFAQAILRRLSSGEGELSGSAAELLEQLIPQGRVPRDFPTSPTGLGDRLRRIAPQLAAVGVSAALRRAHGRRLWTITREEIDA